MGNWRTPELWDRPKRTYPDPATVKATLTGGDPLGEAAERYGSPPIETMSLDDSASEAEVAALLKAALERRQPKSPDDNTLRIDPPQHVGLIQQPPRCITCGRAAKCACGPDCPHCVEGQPRADRQAAK